MKEFIEVPQKGLNAKQKQLLARVALWLEDDPGRETVELMVDLGLCARHSHCSMYRRDTKEWWVGCLKDRITVFDDDLVSVGDFHLAVYAQKDETALQIAFSLAEAIDDFRKHLQASNAEIDARNAEIKRLRDQQSQCRDKITKLTYEICEIREKEI